MYGIAALQTGAKDVFTSFQRDVNKDVEHTVSYADICYLKNVPEPLVFDFMHSDEVALFKRDTRRKLHACPSSDSTLTFIIRWIFDHTSKVLAARCSSPDNY
jgi:hypothetical protein